MHPISIFRDGFVDVADSVIRLTRERFIFSSSRAAHASNTYAEQLAELLAGALSCLNVLEGVEAVA